MLISFFPSRKGPARPPIDPASADPDQAVRTPKLSAVIVEDDFVSLVETENVARDSGLEVVDTAVSADEALKAIEEHRPDLVLMDINLGGDRDGIDIALEINRRFGIRSLFTTAYSDNSLRSRASACNPLGWVSKPFSSDALRKAITDAMKGLKPRN